jgi:predicted transcriptional regulator
MRVILSIKPEYAFKILEGSKRFEFRKKAFSKAVKTVLIYATMPVGKVVGEFDIEAIHIDRPEKIWESAKEFSGVQKDFFDEYYKNRDVAMAIGVGRVRRYETPLKLAEIEDGLTAPQSFKYLKT